MKRLDLNAIVKVKGGRRTGGHDIEGLAWPDSNK